MNAMELLVFEHETITRMIWVMRKACLGILGGGQVPVEDFRQFISFIRLYADKGHHGKEEAFLFQEMEQHLGGVAQTLIRNGMLVEHDLARLYVKQLEDALASYVEYEMAGDKLDIITNAMAYADLLKRHIDRENEAVYPFARQRLPAQVMEQLDAQTQQFETDHTQERERQLAVLGVLERKYNQ